MNTLDRILRLVRGTYEAQRSPGGSSSYRDDISAYQRMGRSNIDPMTGALPYDVIMRLIVCALNEFCTLTGRPTSIDPDFVLTPEERSGLLAMSEKSETFFEQLIANRSKRYYEYCGVIDNNVYNIFHTNALVQVGAGARIYRTGNPQSLLIAVNMANNGQVISMPGIRGEFRINPIERYFRETNENINVVSYNILDVANIHMTPDMTGAFKRRVQNGGPAYMETIVQNRWFSATRGLTLELTRDWIGAISLDYMITAVEKTYLDNGQYRSIPSPFELGLFSMINLTQFSQESLVNKIEKFLRQTTNGIIFDVIVSTNLYYNETLAKILMLGDQLRPTNVGRRY